MAYAWPDLDTALALVGCERAELERACRDGYVKWHARDDSGALLEPAYNNLWTGEVDWSVHPPRFAIEELVLAWIIEGPNPPPKPPRWREVEVERKSLLEHFGEPEPVRVHVQGSVEVRSEPTPENRGRNPVGKSQSPEILRAFEALASQGGVSFEHGGLAAAVRQLEPYFHDYSHDGIRHIIESKYQELKAAANKKE